MFGFATLAGRLVESKNQLLQVNGEEIAQLTIDQAKAWGVQGVRSIKQSGTIRVGVLKEQIARMNAIEVKKAEQEESERRAAILAVASMNQNCFNGSDC